ncbi:MAG: hypothetical protein GY913_16510 [Proteobacteria bacterium]|nr:hypothetical protein [Pseudomonadota bacterium]
MLFRDDGSVEVELDDGEVVPVELGLSDGIRAEVQGLSEGQVVFAAP